jgi:hypothetical protein
MKTLKQLQDDIAKKPYAALTFGCGEVIVEGHFATAREAHDCLWSAMHRTGRQGQVAPRALPSH